MYQKERRYAIQEGTDGEGYRHQHGQENITRGFKVPPGKRVSGGTKVHTQESA